MPDHSHHRYCVILLIVRVLKKGGIVGFVIHFHNQLGGMKEVDLFMLLKNDGMNSHVSIVDTLSYMYFMVTYLSIIFSRGKPRIV